MAPDAVWTPGMVAGRLAETARTLAVVETVRGPSTAMSWWPSTIADRRTDYPSDTTRAPRSRATPEQITRMDETLALMTELLSEQAIQAWNDRPGAATKSQGRIVLVPDAAWLLMHRAIGWSWEKIGRSRNIRWNVRHTERGPNRHCPGGNSRKSLMAIERDALTYLAAMMVLRDVAVTDVDVKGELPSGVFGTKRRERVLAIAPPRTPPMGEVA